MDLLPTLFYIIFVLSAIVLIVVILLQEGKGGGFGQALGEHGTQTFGVGAKGINTFTGYTAAVFLVSAMLLHFLNRAADGGSLLDPEGVGAPADVGGAAGGTGGAALPPIGGPPAGGTGGGGQPPK